MTCATPYWRNGTEASSRGRDLSNRSAEERAYGVEVAIPDRNPTTVTGFATEQDAQRWIAEHRRQAEGGRRLPRPPAKLADAGAACRAPKTRLRHGPTRFSTGRPSEAPVSGSFFPRSPCRAALRQNNSGGGDTHNHYYKIDARYSTDPAATDLAVRRGIVQATPDIVAKAVRTTQRVRCAVPSFLDPRNDSRRMDREICSP